MRPLPEPPMLGYDTFVDRKLPSDIRFQRLFLDNFKGGCSVETFKPNICFSGSIEVGCLMSRGTKEPSEKSMIKTAEQSEL